MEEPDQVRDWVLRAVAENIDNLMTLDLRGWHVGRTLYEAARRQLQQPLAMAAARATLPRMAPGATVVICTGFRTPPWEAGETDGPIGAAVLARATDRFFGATPVVVCEEELVQGMQSLVNAAGLNIADTHWQAVEWPAGCYVSSFTKDAEAAPGEATRLVDEWSPAVVIAVERPGANAQGVYHSARGVRVSDLAAKIDYLFEKAGDSGALTIGIGDVGNELGMGSLIETALRISPSGGRCECGCESGPSAALVADYPIVASVSDWGAYALAAAWAALLGKPELLHGPELQSRLMVRANQVGLLDGPGVRPTPAIDGVGEEYHRKLVQLLRFVVEEPLKYMEERAGFLGEMMEHRLKESY